MSEKQKNLEKERKVFDSHIEDWRKTNLGQFVLIKDEKLLGFFKSANAAFEKGTDLFGLEEFFIEQILPAGTVNVTFFGQDVA